MDKLDAFLETIGVELYPYQKEVLRYVINGERFYIIFPPYYRLPYVVRIPSSKGENNVN